MRHTRTALVSLTTAAGRPGRSIWLAAIALPLLAGRAAAEQQDIGPGIDLWVTTPGTTTVDFSSDPIPADFFAPGSEPFAGTIALRGRAFGGPLGPTDTIVERLHLINFTPGNQCDAECPAGADVAIRLVAMNLVGTGTITVIINGVPTQWDVEKCLSDCYLNPQPGCPTLTGQMALLMLCPSGGTFNSTLPVASKFRFTPVGGGNPAVLDLGLAGHAASLTAGGHWVYRDVLNPALGILEVPAGLMVDGNCDGVLDPPLPGSSSGVCDSMAVGVRAVPCATCTDQPTEQFIVTSLHIAPNAEHGVTPARLGASVPAASDIGIGAILSLLLMSGMLIFRRRTAAA